MLKPFDVFTKYIPSLKKSHADEYKACCPFHKEDKPSFYVNSTTGQYICFGCGVVGNVYTFLDAMGDTTLKKKISREYVYDNPQNKTSISYISQIVIEQFHKNLLRDMNVLSYVMRERLLSMFVIKKFLLGYDPLTDRIAFPIRTTSGKFVNIKLHNSELEIKSLYYSPGNGGKKLFPMQSLFKQDIVLCEGEFDCMVLHTLGINGITSTSGVASFQEEWLHFFKGKDIKIAFDNDEPGNFYSEVVKGMLTKVASSVEIILIPKPEGEKKVDITDYVKQKKDIHKLLKIQRRY